MHVGPTYWKHVGGLNTLNEQWVYRCPYILGKQPQATLSKVCVLARIMVVRIDIKHVFFTA